MITTKKLKIWTIISHGLIIVGAGHGILFLFIIEIFFFPYVTKDNFNFSFSTDDNHFPIVGLTTLLGQTTLVLSILNKKQKLKNIFQVIGLCLLWLSIVYFINDTTKDAYIHLALITVIPFAICTIISLIGHHISRLYNWIDDK
jgi:peptidoglycan/LPS O-acetylase OafA/YrhL